MLTTTQADTDQTELLRLWTALDASGRELALFCIRMTAEDRLADLLAALDHILASRAVQARGEPALPVGPPPTPAAETSPDPAELLRLWADLPPDQRELPLF